MKTNRRKHKNTNDKKKKINRKNTTKRSKKTMNTIQYYHNIFEMNLSSSFSE